MEWNDETIARLRALWTEGHSTAEIGRRLGVSKNAVVGKAHRLNLDARPSPIRRDPSGATPRQPSLRRLVGPTLPSLAVPAPSADQPSAPEMPAAAERRLPPVPAAIPAPAPRAVRPPPPPAERVAPVRAVAARSGRVAPCCWPIGEPGTRSFRFCDAQSAAGKPYCAEHAQLAYVKVRDRREEAA